MQNINYAFLLSRPVWGAWIEIPARIDDDMVVDGRAPYGARGLKLYMSLFLPPMLGVAPRMGRVD